MSSIEILEIFDTDLYEQGLISLLTNSVNNGASIGFLAPIEETEVSQYWDGVRTKLNEGSCKLWIALHQGQVVGSVHLSLVGKKNGRHRAEVEKLMVMTSARKQGIATLLLARLEMIAIELGVQLLFLDTREGDVSELLYRKVGFVRVGIIPKFALSSNGDYDGTVIYYKLLNQS